MTDLPSQDQMSQAKKATRMIELQQMNNECDKRLGRDTSPLFTEKNLSKATKDALDATEQRKPVESKLTYKLPEGMAQKLDNFDAIIKNRPSPHYKTGPISAEERLLAWHRHLGTPDPIVQAELKQLREGKQ